MTTFYYKDPDPSYIAPEPRYVAARPPPKPKKPMVYGPPAPSKEVLAANLRAAHDREQKQTPAHHTRHRRHRTGARLKFQTAMHAVKVTAKALPLAAVMAAQTALGIMVPGMSGINLNAAPGVKNPAITTTVPDAVAKAATAATAAAMGLTAGERVLDGLSANITPTVPVSASATPIAKPATAAAAMKNAEGFTNTLYDVLNGRTAADKIQDAGLRDMVEGAMQAAGGATGAAQREAIIKHLKAEYPVEAAFVEVYGKAKDAALADGAYFSKPENNIGVDGRKMTPIDPKTIEATARNAGLKKANESDLVLKAAEAFVKVPEIAPVATAAIAATQTISNATSAMAAGVTKIDSSGTINASIEKVPYHIAPTFASHKKLNIDFGGIRTAPRLSGLPNVREAFAGKSRVEFRLDVSAPTVKIGVLDDIAKRYVNARLTPDASADAHQLLVAPTVSPVAENNHSSIVRPPQSTM